MVRADSIYSKPGVQDSNAARVAVADKYMRDCNALWIVAPITRAVDDKTSHQLLGDTFRRQLQFDGVFDNITFVCSKTDDISVTEAIQNLNLDQEIDHVVAQLAENEQLFQAQNKLAAPLRDSVTKLKSSLTQYDELIDRIEVKLKTATLAGGATIRARFDLQDFDTTTKRKAGKAQLQARKRQKRSEDDEDESSEGEDESDGDDDADDDLVAVSREVAVEKLEKLKAEKRAQKDKKKQTEKELKPIKARIAKLKAEIKKLQTQRTSFCIKSRNERSKPAIKNQFAAGIKE